MIVTPIAIGNLDRPPIAAAAWRVDASLRRLQNRYEILGTARIGGINDRPTIAGNGESRQRAGGSNQTWYSAAA